jgi:hypothetical protein
MEGRGKATTVDEFCGIKTGLFLEADSSDAFWYSQDEFGPCGAFYHAFTTPVGVFVPWGSIEMQYTVTQSRTLLIVRSVMSRLRHLPFPTVNKVCNLAIKLPAIFTQCKACGQISVSSNKPLPFPSRAPSRISFVPCCRDSPEVSRHSSMSSR